MNRSEVLSHVIDVPTKYEGLKSKPRPFFKFYVDEKGNLRYRKTYFVDLRWSHRDWQKGLKSEAVARLLTGKLGKEVITYVEEMARRHGKTYETIHTGVNALTGIPHDNPIMAYYCPEKSQAIRNAWAALESVTRHLPNVNLDKSKGIVTFSRPTLHNPQDYCTVYLLPMIRGIGSKKGQYYDICVIDEADQADITFVREVCMISCSDRGGLLELKGTPDGNDRLKYWLREARKKVKFREAFNRGEVVDVPDDMIDFKNWYYFQSHAEEQNVYTKEELKKLKVLLGDEIYNNQMLCRDVVENKKYYYRAAMQVVESQGRSSVTVGNNPAVPIRIYYDMGIGSKSDRMAFVIAQHFPTHMAILWSWDDANCGYADVAQAVRMSPYRDKIYEHCVPHDMKSRQQSDKKEKWIIFEEELAKYQVKGKVRPPLRRPVDPKGDLSMVREIIGKTIFNSVHAQSVITALENHARKFNTTSQVYEESPSKTKYRDLADAFRHAAIDYETKEYLGQNREIQIMTPEGKADKVVRVNGVEHIFKGSVLYNEEGEERRTDRASSSNGYVPTHLSY